jgi:hypothetical protein
MNNVANEKTGEQGNEKFSLKIQGVGQVGNLVQNLNPVRDISADFLILYSTQSSTQLTRINIKGKASPKGNIKYSIIVLTNKHPRPG